MVVAVPLTVTATSLMHPAPNSMGEPSVGELFGTDFLDIRGDYRASLGQQESVIQERNAYLTYFENRVTGAKTGNTNTTSFVIQPLSDEDWEIIKGRTGYSAYYVGRHDRNNDVVDNLERAINNYAQFYNGNAQFIKDIILAEVQDKLDYYDFRSQPIYQYGSPNFSIQDMFMLTGDDLFFNISYVSRFSGAGNSTLIEQREPEWNPNDPQADPLEYFSERTGVRESVTTHWPSIEDVQVLDNGDVQYTVKINSIYDNKGYVDVIGNFNTTKSLLPNNDQLASVDLYWRKHAHEYFRNLVANQEGANPFRNFVYEQEIPISAEQSQTFTHTVPQAEIERILSDNGNMLTLYVTDNYGRYAYKEVPYAPEKESCLRFSRWIDDHKFYIHIPSGVRGIGSTVRWSLTYNKNVCAMDEVITMHNNEGAGHRPEKDIYNKALGIWDFQVKPIQGSGVEVKNTSKTESRPLVIQLKRGDNVIKTFSLDKGATKKLNVPAMGDYYLYFPTPSEVSGFWDYKEQIMYYRKASKEFPDYIKPYVDKMLEQYGEP